VRASESRLLPPDHLRMAHPTLYVHADESCLGNQYKDRGSPGGAAGVVEIWREDRWIRRDYWISEPDTTNNRMALRSAIELLRLLTRPCLVHFVSDSQYLVKGMGEWMPGWKARGWKRKGGPIENLGLWKQLDELLQHHDVRPSWVRGHAGHPRNEYANDLAVRAAKKQDRSDGLVASGFKEWLEEEREKDRYMDFYEFLPPAEQDDLPV